MTTRMNTPVLHPTIITLKYRISPPYGGRIAICASQLRARRIVEHPGRNAYEVCDPSFCLSLVPGDIVRAVPAVDGSMQVTGMFQARPGTVTRLASPGIMGMVREELLYRIDDYGAPLVELAPDVFYLRWPDGLSTGQADQILTDLLGELGMIDGDDPLPFFSLGPDDRARLRTRWADLSVDQPALRQAVFRELVGTHCRSWALDPMPLRITASPPGHRGLSAHPLSVEGNNPSIINSCATV